MPGGTSGAVTGYRVGRDGYDSSGSGAWSTTTAATARTWTFTKLRSGTTYTLTVQPLTARGAGAPAAGQARMP